MYCRQRSQYISQNSKKNSFRRNYSRKYGNCFWTVYYFVLIINGPLEFLHEFRCPIENYTTEGITHEYKLIEDKCYFIQIMSRTFKKTQELCETVFGPLHKGVFWQDFVHHNLNPKSKSAHSSHLKSTNVHCYNTPFYMHFCFQLFPKR